ncbi:MAG TPA: twin-arginine translocation signal domain-containing protein, partial [Candidatus Krumholzibacteria bacterium]|nr:twin-arginine translocation signal domain-containing protein [Candidatus Krumholzibacteria bacterium]
MLPRSNQPESKRGNVLQIIQSRRDFLASASLAVAASLLGARPSLGDEPAPEVTTIRFGKIPGICIAPQYVASELLRAEGFTDVRYVESEASTALLDKIASGEVDFTLMFAAPIVVALDAGH